MSLVGPRPERPELVGPLAAMLPGYAERHLVRPGLTGLAQIQLPADSDVESVRRKLVLDHCYVGQCVVWLDVRILFGTVVYLCGFSYASVRRMMRLPNPLPDQDGRGQTPSPGSHPPSRLEWGRQRCGVGGAGRRTWPDPHRLW